MAFARKRAQILSYIGRFLFFFLIIFQVPLFRVPCRGGICTTPLELTCCHLIATEIWPPIVVRSLLYTGAVSKAILKDTKPLPNFNNLLQIYPNIRNFKGSYRKGDLHCVDVLVGSYLSVGGAVLGFLRPGRMSLAGTLLTLWGLKKDLFLKNQTKTHHREDVIVYPTMFVAIFLAFLSIKGDVRKLIRCYRHRRKSKCY